MLWLLLILGARAHDETTSDDDSSEGMCYSLEDCAEAPECYSVECVPLGGKSAQGECVYERLAVDECCLTSDECCAFAAPHQVGICDKNCTCQFASTLQCAEDDDCVGLLSSMLCRNEGECFYPHIEMFAGGPIVYTVPPDVIGDVMIHYRDREFTNGWNRTVPPEIIEKLSQVEYFHRAYDENGYDIEEFNEIPSYTENEAEFVGAAKEMIEYCGTFV